MAAEFGVESEQAKAAASSAADYKNQLVEINRLVKGMKSEPGIISPVTPASGGVVSGDNLKASGRRKAQDN
jgi:hypothetical protein